MIRKAFVMSVNPGREQEYATRHQPIWDDLAKTLREHGSHNYSIFFDPATHQLFGYVEIEDEARWQAVAKTEVCQRWWRFMGDIMPSNPDHSPVSRSLAEVFHLE
jgi:L-rhamnose mutarotase